VVLAYVDVVGPSLTDVLAELSGEVVLVPLLLGTGFHIRVDIPAMLATAPQVRARTAHALGPDPLLASALVDRLEQARAPSSGPVVLASAGSTDPVSQRATVAMADLLGERLGRPAVASYLCAGSPTPADAVAALRAQGHREVAVASYLMTPGFFARRAADAADAAGSVTSAPLGAHGAVARLIVNRYEEAAG
jgi:sirohydrochlorin ferrochelatase